MSDANSAQGKALALLGRLAEQAPAAGKPQEFWALLDRELSALVGCGRAIVTQVPEKYPAADGLRVALTARGKEVGALELRAKPGGFSGEDRAIVESLAPQLALYLLLFAAEEGNNRMEAQLLQMEKMAGIGRLLAGFSHEARNPLFLIIGFTEQLLKQVPDPAVLDKLSKIRSSAKRLETLVKHLLSFSRSSRVTIGPVNLCAIIDATLELLGGDLKGSNVQLVLDLQRDVPTMAGNINTIIQVFFNLITNALQAMEGRPGGKLTLRVKASPDRRRIMAEVEDNGPGMMPEVREKLFTAFFTTKGQKGTGLGLSLVQGFVKDHGGEISVDSTPGRGTTFKMAFPADPEATPLAIVRAPAP